MVAAGSINVAVRVRPPTSWEAARLPETVTDDTIRTEGAFSTPLTKPVASQSSLRNIVQIVDDRVLTFDPEERNASRAFVERGFLPPGTKRYKDRRFIFDRVFRHDAAQTDVYEGTAKPLLKNVLDGYNATIFAYGATGCGKTHTISGTDEDPGIIYLTMQDLFQLIEDRQEDHIVEVQVSFLEIYNEEIRDLLVEPGTPAPRGGLQIREDKSVKVVGLTELRPASADEVKQIVLLGNERRTQSPTHANATSSRSHAVLQVHVTQAPRTASVTEQRTMATLSIIDLAGSERAAATTNMGQRMVEGANINKSLLALGNCINALCASGGALRHIPYRNSKLTRLLKFSLGGNCKTVMIVCVAPTSAHFDDTHNTLIYAERATKIKTKVITRNVVDVNRHVGQYVEAINRLNIEVEELKAKLAGKRDAEAEKEKRKKREAAMEVERARTDMQLKTDQTQPSLLDGATCTAKITAAEVKLKVIRARLAEIDALAASGSLSADLEAERGLLKALASPEEQVLRPESALNARMQKSNNSAAMFEATLRAVSERRSDKLDELSVDNVKLDAKWRKAEMEKLKAEARQEALRETMESHSQTVVSLLGLLGRCTVMLAEAGRTLEDSPSEDAISSLAVSLKKVADSNDGAFKSLIGHTTLDYAVADARPSALDNFKGYPTTLGRASTSGVIRTASGPTSVQPPPPLPKVSRRASSYGTASVTSPLRRSQRSPRKSLRSSLASAVPYGRRGSDKSKKKGVQWRDEVGQGELDDGGLGVAPATTPSVSIFSPGASVIEESISANSIPGRNTPSRAGSESEWEDEKVDDTFTSGSISLSSRSIFSPSIASTSSSSARRPRSSILSSSFLKGKTRSPALGSLQETDEEHTPKRPGPLSDRNMNRSGSPSPSSSTSSSTSTLLGRKTRSQTSPAKRVSATPKTLSSSKVLRRKSNVGPMRVERPRRRSSQIPQLSPQARNDLNGDTSILGKSGVGPRRVAVEHRSPAKRAKRMSLLAVPLSARPMTRLASKASDPNLSQESISFGRKPTWR
ncbi:P-loop containing nucleoside triphosphate hydrolase protein [Irpex lacteus]|nr:P-loop containing nucleoside triphosphate hydrolase protein [Irpex lacteus]